MKSREVRRFTEIRRATPGSGDGHLFVEGEFGEFDGGIFFGKVSAGPGVGEEDDVFVEGVFGKAGTGGENGGFEHFGSDFGRNPAHDLPRGAFEAGVGTIFGLHAVLDDFELEWADGGEEGNALGGILNVECLDDAFLE